MTPEIILSATTFALIGSFTPGPNNAMLLSSGVNYGFQRTLPHIIGITIGYAVMFTAVALGGGPHLAREFPAVGADAAHGKAHLLRRDLRHNIGLQIVKQRLNRGLRLRRHLRDLGPLRHATLQHIPGPTQVGNSGSRGAVVLLQ